VSNEVEGNQTQGEAPQTENTGQAPAPKVKTDISALRNYREAEAKRQESATSADSGRPENGGGGGPTDATRNQDQQSDDREQAIPRDRFDQVNQQKNQYKQQLEQMQTYMQQLQGSQGMQQPQQQPQIGQTGMMHTPPTQQQQVPQPTPQQQDAITALLADPDKKKEWQRKIGKDPMGGIVELIDMAIQSRGTPLLERYANQLQEQIAPLKQNYFQQQINSYEQQRANDPDFQAIQPVVREMAQRASQMGYDLSNPQTMQTVEFVARQAAQQRGTFNPQQNQMQPQPAPFSERPGNSGQQPRASGPQLSAEQLKYAKRFGQTPEQYAASLEAMGVKRNG